MLFELWNKYETKLPKEVFEEKMLEVGDFLVSIKVKQFIKTLSTMLSVLVFLFMLVLILSVEVSILIGFLGINFNIILTIFCIDNEYTFSKILQVYGKNMPLVSKCQILFDAFLVLVILIFSYFSFGPN